MNRIALATSLSLLVVFGAPVAALAAFRTGTDGYIHARDNSIVVQRGSDTRLLFLNEKLYPDTLTLAPIDDENATLAYAFSSGVAAADPKTWCGAVCDVNPNLYHYSAAQDDGTAGGIDRIVCGDLVCWIQ